MDEEAKRVCRILPEAIEAEAVFLSCTQALQYCDAAIDELREPILPKEKHVPTLEEPKTFCRSFDLRIYLWMCYIINTLAMIGVACYEESISVAVLSLFWPVGIFLGLFFGGQGGPLLFLAALVVPITILLIWGSIDFNGEKKFKKSELKRVKSANAALVENANQINQNNQRIADEINLLRERSLEALSEERVNLLNNLANARERRDRLVGKLDFPEYYQNLKALCGVYVLLDKRRALTLAGPDGAFAQLDHDEYFNQILNRLDRISTQLRGLNSTIKQCLDETNNKLVNLGVGLSGIQNEFQRNASRIEDQVAANSAIYADISGKLGQQLYLSSGIKALADYNAKVMDYELGRTANRPPVRYR